MPTQVTTPEEVVGRQLDAYNAKNIDAFMATWSETAQYFEHPDSLLASNAAEIRERHITRFQEPDLHGELISRVVIGDKVIDQEKVTRNFPEGLGQLDVVAIYQVQAGKIVNAWFIAGNRRLLET